MDKDLLENFRREYACLNPEQRRAVDAIEGPVMVIAGPGTGKTQILAMRIANILLQTDAHPSSILALTFTESGVAAMRKRLLSLIGTTGYHVNIFTFHSFCNEVIKTHSEDFPEHIGKEGVSELEQVKILEDVICASDSITHLKPFGEPFYFLRAVLRRINDYKKDGISPDSLAVLLQNEEDAFSRIEDKHYDGGPHVGKMKGKYRDWEKEIAKNNEMLELYRAYQESLARAKQYDYGDMILFVIKALELYPDLLLRLQERYQYILVDEHQDTNAGQNRVIELLGSFHDNPNIFVVGDERQAIYAFQGASLENFIYFYKAYPSVEVVSLVNNYRSVQNILNAADDVARNNSLRIADTIGAVREALVAQKKDAGTHESVTVTAASCSDDERNGVALKVKDLLHRGVPPEEIAIFYRENREAPPLEYALRRNGIQCVIESDRDILDDIDIQKLYRIFRAVAGNMSSKELGAVLAIDFLGVSVSDRYALYQEHNKTGIQILELLDGTHYPLSQSLAAFSEKFSHWAALSAHTPAEEICIAIMNESGWLKSVAEQPDNIEKLRKLHVLFAELRKLSARNLSLTLSDFTNYLDVIRAHGVAIRERRPAVPPSVVRCMTAHRSKGLEFDHVFIVNAVDGVWGGRRNSEKIRLPRHYYANQSADAASSAHGDDEERRLFYVALTRGRYGVHISYANFGDSGREQLPSRFIGELPNNLNAVVHKSADEVTRRNPAALFTQPDAKLHVAHMREENVALLKELFRRSGLSATGVNNYLACPWRYIYSNLLRIPREMSESQRYGTAIHAALKSFFDALRSKNAIGENLIGFFEAEAGRCGLPNRWRIRGIEALTKYHEHYNSSWNKKVATELSVRALLPHIEKVDLSNGIKITGKLDKIEILGTSDRWTEVNVVDYKTGVPKSRNDIEGRTRSSGGDYKRQLVFYKLLLDATPIMPASLCAETSDARGRVKMVSGEIDFIETDKGGKLRKERFDILSDEVDELSEDICRIAQDIFELKFIGSGCGKKECEYCALHEISGFL